MELKTTEVSRCLDKRMEMLGFEIPDLLIIFITISVLNFIFSTSDMRWLFVWTSSLLLTGIIKWSKKGKPDNYLVHWLRFQIKPGILKAFNEPTYNLPSPSLSKGKNT